jgi:beta-lactamase regulating signal transducer with metallopeptidase domain
MSSFFAMRALLFAGELLIASTLVMALASLIKFSNTASGRHLLWLAAFCALLALPALASILPSLVQFAVPAPVVLNVSGLDTVSAVLPPADPGPDFFSVESLAPAAFALWLAGVGLIALRSLVAAFGLRALRRQSVAHDFGGLPEFGPRCDLRISTADESCGPVTWGFLQPVILLPRKSVFWPRERLEAVLLHEMAHIRRHDSFAQMLSLFACAFYWPNPLVWMGARAMRREAEMAADDAVIVAGVRPSAYAGELLQLASEFLAAGPSTALSMAAPLALEARVQSVLAPTQQRSGVTKMDVLKIACAGLLATSALVLARPSLAQDAPQVSSADAAPSAPVVTTAPLAPPAAAVSATPPAPPAPSSPASEAAPAPPSASDISSDDPADADVQVREELRTVDGKQIRRVRMVVRKARIQARHAQEEIARARPEIEKAIAEAKVSEQAAQAIKDAQPQIDEAMRKAGPEIDKALAEVRTDLAKAHLDVKIRARVDAALKRVEVRIQARDADRKDSEHDVVIEDSDAPANK